jgi:hypothetical protein
MTTKTRSGRVFERMQPREELPTDAPPAGCLMVGINPDRMEVVINLDRDRTGHITFSPDQARYLARLLITKADDIDAGNF